MKEYTDNEIIECLRNRQSYVVHYLSERYLPMIRLMVHQMGGSMDDAKDIFQDGLIIMLEKIDNEDFVLTCKFKTFLYSVCENLWRSILVKRQAATNYFTRRVDEDSEKDFTELQDKKLYENIFYNVFDTLDPVCQKILRLYWQELSPKEIADRLGYTYGYVRKKKCEGQAKLISRVKKHPDYRQIMNSERVARGVVY
ncbi:MAG: sigma-70 family RNA polymerase sigma factor [Bacteroidia bacterium]|nr:sigma-70 family RNA polymerase sigma factor [Bacteroidia bacterium]